MEKTLTTFVFTVDGTEYVFESSESGIARALTEQCRDFTAKIRFASMCICPDACRCDWKTYVSVTRFVPDHLEPWKGSKQTTDVILYTRTFEKKRGKKTKKYTDTPYIVF